MEVRQRKLESVVQQQSGFIEQLQVEMSIHREFLRLQFESFMDFLQQRGGDIIRIDSENGKDPQTGLFIPFNNSHDRSIDIDEGHGAKEEDLSDQEDDGDQVNDDDSSMMYPPPQAILGSSSTFDDQHLHQQQHQNQPQQSVSYNSNNGHPSTSSPVNLSTYHKIDRRMGLKQEESEDGGQMSDSEDEGAGEIPRHQEYDNRQPGSDDEVDDEEEASYDNLQYLNQQSYHRFPFAHFLDGEENQQQSNGDHSPSTAAHENGHRQLPMMNEYTTGPRRRTSSATPVENQHICRYCGKVFHWKQSWVIHERTHTGEKPYSCACGKAFSQKANMNTHAKQCKHAKAVHNGKTNIFEMKCSLCPKMFTSKKSLDSHKMKCHPGSLTSVINVIQNGSNNLRNNNSAVNHENLNQNHGNSSNTQQSQQNNHTMTRASLLRKSNTQEINNSPDQILERTLASLSSKFMVGGGNGSGNNNGLSLSLTATSSRASSTASGGSGSSLNLISSISPDGGHPPGKSKHCRWCNKFFSRKTSLKIHERVHTGERPYACGFCGKTFTQKGSVKLHCQRVHNSVSYTNAYANNN